MSETGTPVNGDDLEGRRLRFEARRFALDALLRVHLGEAEEARVYLLSHVRLLSTLSLGALAGTVTLFAAALRFGTDATLPPVRLALAAASLALLVAAALLAARAVGRAASDAAAVLGRPYPDAAHGGLLRGGRGSPSDNEDAVLDALVRLLEQRRGSDPMAQPRGTAIVVLLAVGLGAAGAAVLWPVVLP